MTKAIPIDERRDLIVPGDQEETITFCVEDFLHIAEESIQKRGSFCAALSGGSTPHAIFERLAKQQNARRIDWQKVRLFWSDERSVGPDNPDSNYRMALESGLKLLPIPPQNIFRMEAETHIEENAHAYETLIEKNVPDHIFDLVMLGMGDDGHTASLFPHTEGLDQKQRFVIANYIPQKESWRMTFTYTQIHHARHIRFYVLGEKKAPMLHKVLTSPLNLHELPSQGVGTPKARALWIADQAAASPLLSN